ncbi:hypothetical protein CC86DRAFT_410860 [Ophiobolus disseminans]|uniref:Uncharacterized protein n=1 Tax=Ophiobolus disseminans TaxID=1469910 RepID=A0A6A6ZLM7_9PLEO|nr:hypothetical protein CC86DRAFT_410860 [Ophiobolus disseminans]
MKASILGFSALVVGFAAAQNATSIISVTNAACPTGPPANVVVTRSAVIVPSCAAGGNVTKPSVVSISGGGQPTNSAGLPVFTGAAGKAVVDSFAAVVGFGIVAGLVL